jgi:hypothetical protein
MPHKETSNGEWQKKEVYYVACDCIRKKQSKHFNPPDMRAKWTGEVAQAVSTCFACFASAKP